MRKIVLALLASASLAACGQTTQYVPYPVTQYAYASMSYETCRAWVGDWLVRSKGVLAYAKVYRNSTALYALNETLAESKRISASCSQYGYTQNG